MRSARWRGLIRWLLIGALVVLLVGLLVVTLAPIAPVAAVEQRAGVEDG